MTNTTRPALCQPYVARAADFPEFSELVHRTAEAVISARAQHPAVTKWRGEYPLETRTQEGQLMRLVRLVDELAAERDAIIRTYAASPARKPDGQQATRLKAINGEMAAHYESFRSFCRQTGDEDGMSAERLIWMSEGYD